MRSMTQGVVLLMSAFTFTATACVAEGDQLAGEESQLIEQSDPADSPELFDGSDASPQYWTLVYATDGNPPVTCNTGNLLTGVDCAGSNCDNMYLQCETAPAGTFSTRAWTTWFTDTSSASTNSRVCGGTTGNAYVTGLTCKGSYCDDLSIECTSTSFGAPTECAWSGWYSEEDPSFETPPGRYIKGVQCAGSYCDNLRYYHCIP